MVQKALFVCLGNICRSPIADAVFQHLVKDRGIADQWEVDSAGIGGWHAGSLPDYRARNVLNKYNIEYNGRARQIEDEDFHEFDYIFGMDENNISNLQDQAPVGSKAKILLLGDFDPQGQRIIRDPYYVLLDNSFEPTTSSTQASRSLKRVCRDLEREDSKKLKCDRDSGSSKNKNLTKDINIQNQICIDAFSSPNRVVRRKFPGPAGLLPETEANNKSILQLLESEKVKNDSIEDVPILSQQTNLVFENGPWKEMCKDFHVGNGENLIEKFNIKWIKKQALKQLLNHKAPFLAAIIQNLDIVDGKIPTINVTLKDMTGDIRGTILHSLYLEYSSYFKIGSVLVLKHFGVLSAGHKNHCLTITPNNLMSIYCGEVRRCNENLENISNPCAVEVCVNKILIQDYNVEEILRKYNEDVIAYSEDKRKTNIGSLGRNRSEEVGYNFRLKDNGSSISSNLTIPFIIPKPLESCGSISADVSNTNKTNTILNSSNSEGSSINTDTHYHEDTVKKTFNYKKHYSSSNDNKTRLDKDTAFTCSNKVEANDKTCDSVVITSNNISVKPDKNEHAEIWKTLLEGVDTDSLFDDF